jgi:hypothetical protein
MDINMLLKQLKDIYIIRSMAKLQGLLIFFKKNILFILNNILTMKNFDFRKFLSENKLTAASKIGVIKEEVSISGIISKFKDKITSLPAFQKFIDTVVSKMTDEDIAKFKSKFNIAEAEGIPDLEDIMKKAVALNPDGDDSNQVNEELDRDSIAGKVVNLVRNLTGLNIISLGGAPLGALIAVILNIPWFGIGIGLLVSFIASLIVHNIARKLLGMGDGPIVGDSKINEMGSILDLSQVDMGSIELDGFSEDDYTDIADVYIVSAQFLDGTELTDDELEQLQDLIPDEIYDRALDQAVSRAEDMYDSNRDYDIP